MPEIIFTKVHGFSSIFVRSINIKCYGHLLANLLPSLKLDTPHVYMVYLQSPCALSPIQIDCEIFPRCEIENRAATPLGKFLFALWLSQLGVGQAHPLIDWGGPVDWAGPDFKGIRSWWSRVSKVKKYFHFCHDGHQGSTNRLTYRIFEDSWWKKVNHGTEPTNQLRMSGESPQGVRRNLISKHEYWKWSQTVYMSFDIWIPMS